MQSHTVSPIDHDNPNMLTAPDKLIGDALAGYVGAQRILSIKLKDPDHPENAVYIAALRVAQPDLFTPDGRLKPDNLAQFQDRMIINRALQNDPDAQIPAGYALTEPHAHRNKHRVHFLHMMRPDLFVDGRLDRDKAAQLHAAFLVNRAMRHDVHAQKVVEMAIRYPEQDGRQTIIAALQDKHPYLFKEGVLNPDAIKPVLRRFMINRLLKRDPDAAWTMAQKLQTSGDPESLAYQRELTNNRPHLYDAVHRNPKARQTLSNLLKIDAALGGHPQALSVLMQFTDNSRDMNLGHPHTRHLFNAFVSVADETSIDIRNPRHRTELYHFAVTTLADHKKHGPDIRLKIGAQALAEMQRNKLLDHQVKKIRETIHGRFDGPVKS